MNKVLSWLRLNTASILGILQAVIKMAKEICTLIVNILFPLIPSEKFQGVITKIRAFINKADDVVEKVKSFLLKVGV